jgi:cytochrome oxidase Cu insertion factor (SCO1/SenC/PrrC family)
MADTDPARHAPPTGDGAGWVAPMAALLVVGMIAVVVAVLGWRAAPAPAPVPPAPVPPTAIGEAPAVPAFQLLERSGRTITREDLLGRVWVVGFIFTRCPSTCPVITASMKRLTQQIADPRVGFLSISVDPGWDTVEVLRTYADDVPADPARWWFLTGPPAEIQRVVRDGFRLALELSDDPTQVIHSDRLAIVDRTGRVRAWARGTEAESVDGVPAHVAALLAEPEAAGR